MKSDLRKICKLKWFYSLNWSYSELKQLNHILKHFNIPYGRVKMIMGFKNYKLTHWLQRYKRLNNCYNVSSLYTNLLRYGKNENESRKI